MREPKLYDYVRTKWGVICKIININEYREPELKYGVELHLADIKFIGDEDIIKSSPNIIDLIEIGDYVNGGKVLDIDLDDEIMVIDNIEGFIHYSNGIFNIKSIVTKEQFEVMEYKIDRKKTTIRYKDAISWEEYDNAKVD